MRTLLTTLLFASSVNHPTGTRITPPTLMSVSPAGMARGATTQLIVEGFNLANASAVYFSEPGVKGTILQVKELPDLPDIRLGSNGTPSTVDVGPLPPRNQVTIEVEVSPEAPIGPVAFRLHTPLGTSPEGRFLVEPYYGETADREPDDTAGTAVEAGLPTILTGTISKPGDVDYFRIDVKAGTQLTFVNGAMLTGSTLQPVVRILDAEQKLVGEYGAAGGAAETMFAHKFDKAGRYYIAISDFQQSGRSSHFYRIKVGKFPLASGVYPLGLHRGVTQEISIKGWNVPANMTVEGKSTGDNDNEMVVSPGGAFNRVRLALGDEPEVESAGTNLTPQTAQRITIPVTINGTVSKPRFYRFHARQGEKLILETNARRLGSELDSVLDLFESSGNAVERATVRSVYETSVTLSERDSASRGIRLQAWNGMQTGDYVMAGGEIIRIQALPNGPDEDVLFESFGGQRLAFFDTSPEAHAVDKPVYKVQVHPPGTKFAPNGLPVVRLFYRNDDGGSGYGKDSVIHFVAPAEGDYIVRIQDVRGDSAGSYPFRLTLRPPRPDFRLTVNPRNPNVPVGGSVPVTVTALRSDEFDGPINIEVRDLPAGLLATRGVIAAHQVSTTILLTAGTNARLERASPFQVRGTAGPLEHWASPEDKLKLIALAPPPDITTTAETRVVELEPGGKAEVAVRVQRNNGFAGRVPIEVRNLPPRVFVPGVGLNGVLINEDETHRTFTIHALPNAEPVEQLIYLSGAIETRSIQQNSYAAPTPVLLRVKRH